MKTTLTLFLMFFVLGLSAQPDGSIAHILKESEFKNVHTLPPNPIMFYQTRKGILLLVDCSIFKKKVYMMIEL